MKDVEMNERTEEIVYGPYHWRATPHQKASWEDFWQDILAQAEMRRYNRQVIKEQP
jgi:hypothetical protein